MQAISRRTRTDSRHVGFRSCAAGRSLKLRSSAALQALDQLGAGVILSESDRRVVEMNRAGEAIVRLGDGLVIRNGLLCAGRVFETAKLVKLILTAAFDSKTEDTAGRMLIRRSDYRSAYVLTIAPLRVDAGVGDRRLATIVVVDPRQHSASEKDLAAFFGFSPAEARLSIALMTGKKLSEIAPDFGLQVTTLRSQLRSILKKAGAARQSDLVRILSNAGIGSVSFAAGWLDVAMEALQLPLSLAGV